MFCYLPHINAALTFHLQKGFELAMSKRCWISILSAEVQQMIRGLNSDRPQQWQVTPLGKTFLRVWCLLQIPIIGPINGFNMFQSFSSLSLMHCFHKLLFSLVLLSFALTLRQATSCSHHVAASSRNPPHADAVPNPCNNNCRPCKKWPPNWPATSLAQTGAAWGSNIFRVADSGSCGDASCLDDQNLGRLPLDATCMWFQYTVIFAEHIQKTIHPLKSRGCLFSMEIKWAWQNGPGVFLLVAFVALRPLELWTYLTTSGWPKNPNDSQWSLHRVAPQGLCRNFQ